MSTTTPRTLRDEVRDEAWYRDGIEAQRCPTCYDAPAGVRGELMRMRCELDDDDSHTEEAQRLDAAYDDQLIREVRYDLLNAVSELEELFHTDGSAYTVAIRMLMELRERAFGDPKRQPLSKQLRFMVYRRDGYQCVECAEHEIHELSVDHIVPVKAGGTNEPSNLRTLCRRCNSRKGARL